jgi:urea ABC transporter permease protein UrtB
VDTVVVQILNTASLAATLVLVGMGLGVILSLMGIINLAHGEFLMVGAYTVYLVDDAGWLPAYWGGLLLAPVVVAVLALVLERGVVRRLYRRPLDTLLATFGLGIVLREGVSILFGAEQKNVTGPFKGSVGILGVTYPSQRVFLIVAGAIVLTGFVLVYTRTMFGLRVRATISQRHMAEAIGINTRRINQVSFALGAAIAGFAGALIAPVFVASPDMGVRWIVPAFLVVIVGGMGSIYAAVVGGIAIATLQASSEYFYSLSVAQVIVFAAAILVVRFRPRGLIGAA